MGYFNSFFQFGLKNFFLKCSKFGIDGLIIVDLPYPENKIFSKQGSDYFVQGIEGQINKETCKLIFEARIRNIYMNFYENLENVYDIYDNYYELNYDEREDMLLQIFNLFDE